MSAPRKYGVLVVDDFDDTRELFGELLMHEGYHSVMARNGQEALARLDYVQPDVILSDLEMPDMAAPEMIMRVRADARFKSIPIIIVTGSTLERAARSLGEAAAHVHTLLQKPVQLGALLTVVAEALATTSRR